MSIYLTKTVQHASKIESFEKRGLSGHVSCKASEAGISLLAPIPISNALKYAYVLDELLSIRDRAVKYYGSSKMTNILSKLGGYEFEAPTLIVEMKQGGEVLNSYGMFEAATGKMGLYAGKPSVDNLRQISQLGLDFYTTVPAGNVNLSGYFAFVTAWRAIRGFFSIGAGLSVAKGARLYVGEKGARAVRGREAVPAELDEGGNVVVQAVPEIKPGGILFTVDAGPVTGPGDTYGGIRIMNSSNVQEAAKGHIFPYFREMLDVDPDGTFSIFMKYFHSCFSDTEEELAQASVLYRRGFRYLASTQPGKVLQHIFFGMDLAIRSGAMLFLLKDGADYAGFFLEGEFKLQVKNRVVKWLDGPSISSELSKINSHSLAVEKLHELLLAIPRIDADEETVTPDALRLNPRLLRKMVQDRPAESVSDVRSSINELIGDLKYQQTYWPIDSQHILRFLMAVNSGSRMDDEPFYVHIDTIMNRSSEVFPYLAVFGGQAPSIFFGDTVKSISRIDVEDPNLHTVAGKRAVPHIPFVKKGIIAAAADWASVARTKTFKFKAPKPSKGGMSGFSAVRDRDGVIASPDFDAFYTTLRTWVYRNDKGGAGSSKGKRKVADSMDEDEAPESKKARTNFTFL